MKRALFCFVALWSLVACRPNDYTPTDFGYNYLPLELGAYAVYDVDSIVYDEFTGDSTKYQYEIKSEVVEVYDDLSGRPTYRFEVAKRTGDTAEFQTYRSFTMLVDGVRAELNDNNRITVPLIFPPTTGERWNGNAFNGFEEQTYWYDYTHRSEEIGPLTFDSTLRVIHRLDTLNFIRKRFSESRYAKHAGLVYHERMNIKTNINGDSGLHWIQTVKDVHRP